MDRGGGLPRGKGGGLGVCGKSGSFSTEAKLSKKGAETLESRPASMSFARQLEGKEMAMYARNLQVPTFVGDVLKDLVFR